MNTDSGINEIYTTTRQRIISAITLFFFVFSFYAPTVYAAYDAINKQNTPPINSLEYINPFGSELEQLQSQAQKLGELLQVNSNATTDDIAQLIEQIHNQSETLRTHDETLREQIDAETAHLIDANVSDEIIARNETFLSNYDHHVSGIFSQIDALAKWDQIQGVEALTPILAELNEHLKYSTRNPQQSFSGDLDFIDPPPRNIYTNQSQIQSLLGVSDSTTWAMSDYLETDSATNSTPRIEALVNQLGIDPVALYNWTHDNLRYIPSYGVMQGADYTLQTKRGNAFDISSTLIALYRQAGIHARYVYGTVAFPAEAVQNWVGGVSNVDAATNLLSQGGIPQRQLSYGGAIEEVEMEHVWVEAYIGGEWVAMDPSFKKYTYTAGIDVLSELPFDSDSLMNDLMSTGEVSSTDGWVAGFDSSIVQNNLSSYQNELKAYLNNNYGDIDLEGVLGTQQVIASNALLTEEIILPFSRIAIQQHVAMLPEQLNYRFILQIGDTYGGSFGLPVEWEAAAAELSELTSNLVGKSLAISFRPASAEDEQLILSYIPDGMTDLSQLPSSLPANTIRMIGEITLDGVVVSATSEVTLGQALMTRLGFVAPQRNWSYSENNLVAGTYQAIGLDMQGISHEQLDGLQSSLSSTKAVLETQLAEQIEMLTKHDLVGGILQAGIQTYLSKTYTADRFAALGADIITYRGPSYGTFSLSMEVSYFFGMPRSTSFNGLVMDVDRIQNNNESKENCYEDWLAFNKASGMRSSAYEHLIPEKLFAQTTSDGVSTAKALSLAMSQGQKIYVLTQENASQLSNVTIDNGARAEIQEALLRGMEVTVHESPVAVRGWQGSGYSVIDPEYGIGAYKISGGANGGFLDAWNDGLGLTVSAALGFASLLATLPGVATYLIVMLAVLSIIVAVINIINIEIMTSGCPDGLGEMGQVFELLAVFLSFFGAAGVSLASWISFFVGGAVSGTSTSTICNR